MLDILKLKTPFWLVVLTITLFACGVWFLASVFLNEQSLKAWLDSYLMNSVLGLIVLVAAMIFLLTIGMPRQLAAFAAGYCYGTIEGTLLATLCATIACWLTLSFSRYYLSGYFSRKFPQRLMRVHSFFNRQTFVKSIIIRILPVGSNFLTNVLAGIAKSPTKPYVLGSGIGFIPQMYIFSLAGSGIKFHAYQQVYVSIALLVVASVLGTYIYYQSKLKLNNPLI